MSDRVFRAGFGTVTLIALAALWELSDRLGWIALEFTARPSEIAEAWWNELTSTALLDHTLHTLWVFVLAWVIATVGGAAVGIAIGLWRPVGRLLASTTNFLRFVPPPALIPIVLLLWGFTNRSEVTIAAFAATWPVLINARSGVLDVDERLFEVGRVLHLGRWDVTRKFVLPGASPMIVTGARIGSSVALIVVITAEMLGVPSGIGHEIHRLSQAFRPAEAFAYVVWAGVLGVAINVAVRRAERRILRWMPAT